MTDSLGPVYEVTHTVTREISADFDVWRAFSYSPSSWQLS